MSISTDQFVQRLIDSGIMSSDQLHTLTQTLPRPLGQYSTVELAKELVRRGSLTKYQAKAIYTGKAKSLVLGDYEVLDKLGSGGMGQVYKARHRRLERLVALKILPEATAQSSEAIKRFQREVRAAGKLEHPNIVTAHDAGQMGEVHFLVMQFVEGVDLRTLVAEAGPLPLARVLEFTLQAARGLAHAHAQGVVHRDIKPSNLLVDHSGTVKILDMGLARFVDEFAASNQLTVERLTMAGQMLGTADYMSPEQADDTREADVRSDIYSLGCTFHYLLTGNPPFVRDSIVATLEAHHYAEIPHVDLGERDVTDDVNSILQRMLAKQPDDRYQSVSDIVFDLELCLLNHIPSPAGLDLPGEDLISIPILPSRPAALERSAEMDSGFEQSAIARDATRRIDTMSTRKIDRGAPIAVTSEACDRQVACWVLERGGTVVVEHDDSRFFARTASNLPALSFVLETIGLEYNKLVSDGELSRLRGLRELKYLYLHGTNVTDEGLRHIGRVPSLTHLSLGKTKISSRGITALSALKRLKHLSLSGTGIGDDAADHLARLGSLETLIMDGTPMSPAGLTRLRAALPNCTITIG